MVLERWMIEDGSGEPLWCLSGGWLRMVVVDLCGDRVVVS